MNSYHVSDHTNALIGHSAAIVFHYTPVLTLTVRTEMRSLVTERRPLPHELHLPLDTNPLREESQ